MKHVVVVAEGVEPALLRRMVAEGRLPWFAAASRSAGLLPLDCGPVPYEPSNLATAFSGQGAGVHGCFSYWSIREGGAKPRVLDRHDVHAPRIWEWPEMADVRFGIVNVQLTHPPQAVNGNLISYPMAATLRASHPPGLLSDLARQGVRYAHDVTVFYRGGDLDAFADEARRAAEYQLDAACALANDCDVLIVNLTLPDRLSHFLWSEVENEERLGRPSRVAESYAFVDYACARLDGLRQSGGSMLVFSEIGFGGLDGFVSLDALLQQRGLQRLDRDGNVDLSRSLAFEAVQGSHGIILAGSMGAGFASEDAERAAVEEARDALLSLRFEDGSPVLQSVRHRSEVYAGPHLHLAPDLIVKPANLRRPPLGNPRWAQHVRRDLQTGWHRDQGFVTLLSGQVLAPPPDKVPLECIAPTIARMAGCAVPGWCPAAPLIA